MAQRLAESSRVQRPRDRGIVVVKLYLLLDVVERVGGVNGEANQDNMRVGVRERAETVIVLLTSSIPEGQLHVLAVNLDVGDIVFEDGGDVDLDEVKNSELAASNSKTFNVTQNAFLT